MDPAAVAIDIRSDRAVQSTIGVLALASFVFGVPWLVPLLGLLLTPGAIRGPAANPFHLAYTRLVAPRLPPGTDTIPAATVRSQDTLLAALCGIATLAFVIDIGAIGWLVVIVAAVVAILAATTQVHLGDQLTRFTR